LTAAAPVLLISNQSRPNSPWLPIECTSVMMIAPRLEWVIKVSKLRANKGKRTMKSLRQIGGHGMSGTMLSKELVAEFNELPRRDREEIVNP
jgi:hypothetical protein